MTAFALTDQQRSLAEQVRVIAAEQLRPLAEAGRPGRPAGTAKALTPRAPAPGVVRAKTV